MRLVGAGDPDFNGRAHFLGVAARLMRQILVDHARTRNASKRNGGARVPLEESVSTTGKPLSSFRSTTHWETSNARTRRRREFSSSSTSAA